jgi:hypothetical protein
MKRLAVALCLSLVAHADTAAEQPLSPSDKETVHRLVERWSDAQNQGDFTLYSSFYAEPFSGVRRSGSRVVSFDRAGWLADRQRMFQKPMVVHAEHLRAVSVGTILRVRFTQNWSSGSYHDVGEKELLITREKGELRIAREELLASRRVDVASLLKRVATLSGMVILHERSAVGFVVIADGVPTSWAKGEPSLYGKRDDRPVWATLAPSARLPRELQVRGTPIHVYDEKGQLVCDATLGPPQIRARMELPRSENSSWSRASAAALAVEAWQDGLPMLVADIVGAGCARGVLARAANLPPLVPFVDKSPGDSGDRFQLAAEEHGHPVVLEGRHDDRYQLMIQRDGTPAGNIRPGCCERWAPFAADLDGDGVLELILPGNIIRQLDGSFDLSDVEIDLPSRDMDEDSGC